MPTEIDRQRVQQLLAAGAQFVDVLPAEEHEAEHLPGAIIKELTRDTAARLDPSRPAIVYCWDHK